MTPYLDQYLWGSMKELKVPRTSWGAYLLPLLALLKKVVNPPKSSKASRLNRLENDPKSSRASLRNL